MLATVFSIPSLNNTWTMSIWKCSIGVIRSCFPLRPRSVLFSWPTSASIIQGWNRKNNSRHRELNSPDWYFSADIAQFFYKHWPIIFLYGRRSFVGRYCLQNLQCRSARVFRARLCFGRHWHVLISSATKTLAHLGKKHDSSILIEKNASRRWPGKDDRSRS